MKTTDKTHSQSKGETLHLFRFLNVEKLVVILVIVGIALRIAQFIYNRSFTEGEAPVAINILQHSYAEILCPSDYVEITPIGFSMIEKVFVSILGDNEYAFRIFPLLAGIIALFLFLKVGRKCLNPGALLIALILFAVNDNLIYFSSELRPYSSDVAFTLAVLLVLFYVLSKKLTRSSFILMGIAGGISIWFSFPSLFAFLAALIVLLIKIIKKKEWNNLFWLFFAGVLALFCLAINYSLILYNLSKNKDLLECFQRSFMPLLPKSLEDFQWFGYGLLRIFKNPLGFSEHGLIIPFILFFIGFIAMSQKKRSILAILLFPVIIALIASGLKKYPFEGRLLLFTTPAMIFIVAEGIEFLEHRILKQYKSVSIVVALLLLSYPVVLAGYHLIKPRAPEELRPVVRYVKMHQQENDVIYAYYAAANALRYYATRFDLNQDRFVIGVESRDKWVNYYDDLRRFEGSERFWIVFSHVTRGQGTDEEELFLSYLDILGRRLDSFKASGASAYLYDLSH